MKGSSPGGSDEKTRLKLKASENRAAAAEAKLAKIQAEIAAKEKLEAKLAAANQTLNLIQARSAAAESELAAAREAVEEAKAKEARAVEAESKLAEAQAATQADASIKAELEAKLAAAEENLKSTELRAKAAEAELSSARTDLQEAKASEARAASAVAEASNKLEQARAEGLDLGSIPKKRGLAAFVDDLSMGEPKAVGVVALSFLATVQSAILLFSNSKPSGTVESLDLERETSDPIATMTTPAETVRGQSTDLAAAQAAQEAQVAQAAHEAAMEAERRSADEQAARRRAEEEQIEMEKQQRADAEEARRQAAEEEEEEARRRVFEEASRRQAEEVEAARRETAQSSAQQQEENAAADVATGLPAQNEAAARQEYLISRGKPEGLPPPMPQGPQPTQQAASPSISSERGQLPPSTPMTTVGDVLNSPTWGSQSGSPPDAGPPRTGAASEVPPPFRSSSDPNANSAPSPTVPSVATAENVVARETTVEAMKERLEELDKAIDKACADGDYETAEWLGTEQQELKDLVESIEDSAKRAWLEGLGERA